MIRSTGVRAHRRVAGAGELVEQCLAGVGGRSTGPNCVEQVGVVDQLLRCSRPRVLGWSEVGGAVLRTTDDHRWAGGQTCLERRLAYAVDLCREVLESLGSRPVTVGVDPVGDGHDATVGVHHFVRGDVGAADLDLPRRRCDPVRIKEALGSDAPLGKLDPLLKVADLLLLVGAQSSGLDIGDGVGLAGERVLARHVRPCRNGWFGRRRRIGALSATLAEQHPDVGVVIVDPLGDRRVVGCGAQRVGDLLARSPVVRVELAGLAFVGHRRPPCP